MKYYDIIIHQGLNVQFTYLQSISALPHVCFRTAHTVTARHKMLIHFFVFQGVKKKTVSQQTAKKSHATQPSCCIEIVALREQTKTKREAFCVSIRSTLLIRSSGSDRRGLWERWKTAFEFWAPGE